MTYKQARNLDYEELSYNQFLLTTALYKRAPFRCIYYTSESDTKTLVIFSKTKSGNIVTRHLRFNKTGAENIINRLHSDFNITAEEIDADEE